MPTLFPASSHRLWSTLTGECRGALVGHTDVVAGVAFSPDGGVVVTSSSDKTLKCVR
jgi:WD40 repeat protein